jgi:hypothetical protein
MKKKTVYLFVLLIFSVLTASAQQDSVSVQKKKAEPVENFSLFEFDNIICLDLRFDLTNYLKKNAAGTSQSAVMVFNPGTPDSLVKDVTISTRGTFRREHCSLAPMEITFKRSVYAYPDTGKIKKIKLVSTCQFGNRNDEYVLREYLVYRMFNALTDSSFRVRLVKITYIDTKKNRKPVEMYGFFIEPKNIMATRLNSVVVNNMNLTQKDIDLTAMDKVSVFNYMVGNWDWAVQSLHNVVILKSMRYSPTSLGVAVPYDFDLTGIVDPDYNVPPPETGLKSNRDRRFMGICRQKEVYFAELKWFKGEKEKLYSLVNDFQYLKPVARKDITTYLDSFFDQLIRPKSTDNLVGLFLTNCLKY